MSISVPLAVTMMIGTDDRARMERHTSIPESRGSMRSSSTRSGLTEAKSRRASLPSRATVTSKPSRVSPMTSASMNDSSSSASSTLVCDSSATAGGCVLMPRTPGDWAGPG